MKCMNNMLVRKGVNRQEMKSIAIDFTEISQEDKIFLDSSTKDTEQ